MGEDQLREIYTEVKRILELPDIEKQLSLYIHHPGAPWNMTLASDRGRGATERFARELSLSLPVEFVYEDGELLQGDNLCANPILIRHSRDEDSGLVEIELVHSMKYHHQPLGLL